MKTTSLKTIYLTADELKQAIVEYLEKEHKGLAQHLPNNECEMAEIMWEGTGVIRSYRPELFEVISECR